MKIKYAIKENQLLTDPSGLKVGDKIFVISGNNIRESKFDNKNGIVTEISFMSYGQITRVSFSEEDSLGIWCYTEGNRIFKYKKL